MADSTHLPDFASIRDTILASSPITRLGLACPSEQARERAADDLARDIAERLSTERNQLKLAL